MGGEGKRLGRGRWVERGSALGHFGFSKTLKVALIEDKEVNSTSWGLLSSP